MLSAEAINEFKQIYLEEYGVNLTHEQATEKATHLVEIFKVFALPGRTVELTPKEE